MRKKKTIRNRKGIEHQVITLVFKRGRMNEKQQARGYTHLAEHYMCTCLEKLKGISKVSGYIEDRVVIIHIEATQEIINRITANSPRFFLQNALFPLKRTIIANEISRILVELDNVAQSTLSVFSRYVQKVIIENPKNLIIEPQLEIKNLKHYQENFFIKTLEDLFAAEWCMFDNEGLCIQGDSSALPTLNIQFSNKHKVLFPKNKKHAVFIAGFSTQGLKHTYTELLALRFTTELIHEQFTSQIKEIGIYQPYYQHHAEREYGVVWFGAYSQVKIPSKIKNLFFEAVKRTLADKELLLKLETFKKGIKTEMKRDWTDSFEKQDWLVEDALYFSKKTSIKKASEEVDMLTIKVINKVVKDFLSPKHAYLFM